MGYKIMANYCNNDLVITGAEAEVKKTLALIVNQKTKMDFSILLPYPEAYKTELQVIKWPASKGGAAKAPDDVMFDLSHSDPCRISLLTKTTFLEALNSKKAALSAEKTVGVLGVMLPISGLNEDIYDSLAENMALSPFFDDKTPVEVSLSKAIKQDIIDNDGSADKWNKDGQPFLKDLLAILKASHESYCMRNYGYINLHYWAMDNWGMDGAIDGQAVDIKTDESGNTVATVFFSTNWQPPSGWFAALVKKIHEDNIKVEAKLAYIDGGGDYGGQITQDLNGLTLESEYDEEELAAIIEANEDDEYEDE